MENKFKQPNVNKLLQTLEQTYPDAHCELNFENPFQLLIATILSAQSTDKKVNSITAILFVKYQTPQDFIDLGQAGLEIEIKQLGLYRHKAKNILATCHDLLNLHNGQVPTTIDSLMTLPGVGRKTANVVAGNAFGLPALAVDTHVFRVSNRIGIANSQQVFEVERQLKESIPQDKWNLSHHLLIWHGRRCCTARNPSCQNCPVQAHCHYYSNQEP